MKLVAIADNTMLANMLALRTINALQLLQNLYQGILIPEKVKNELANYRNGNLTLQRQQFVDRLQTDYGFYRLCVSYDPIIKQELLRLKGMHEGEAEAVAQAYVRGVHFFLTDDQPCQRVIAEKKLGLRCRNSLFLVCLLDCYGLLTDYESVIREFYTISPFTPTTLREAYNLALRELGLSISKKELSYKIMFTKLGLNP